MQFESIPNQTTTYDVGRAHSAEEHIVGVCHPKHQKEAALVFTGLGSAIILLIVCSLHAAHSFRLLLEMLFYLNKWVNFSHFRAINPSLPETFFSSYFEM